MRPADCRRSSGATVAETPALSPSIAHVLLEESPLHAWTIHRLLGGRPRPSTSAQESGRLLHALLLEGGAGVQVIECEDFRAKAARIERDAVRADGGIPVPRPRYEEAVGVVAKLRESLAAQGIDLEGGSTEVKVEWHDPGAHGSVLCHGRFDWWSADRLRVIDLKTSDGSAHPQACAAKLVREGGVLQAEAYRRAVEHLHPELIGRVEVLFLFAETSDPFVVTPILCGGTMRELGALRWKRALDLWSWCLARDRWPSYVEGPIEVEAPSWALNLELAKEITG